MSGVTKSLNQQSGNRAEIQQAIQDAQQAVRDAGNAARDAGRAARDAARSARTDAQGGGPARAPQAPSGNEIGRAHV